MKNAVSFGIFTSGVIDRPSGNKLYFPDMEIIIRLWNHHARFMGLLAVAMSLAVFFFFAAGRAASAEQAPQTTSAKQSGAQIPSERPAHLPVKISWQDHQRAVQLYARGQHQESFELQKKIEKTKLSSRQRHLLTFLEGVTAYHLGRHTEVELIFSREQDYPPELKPYALYFRGKSNLQTGKTVKGRQLLTEYVKSAPYGLFALDSQVHSAEALFRAGRRNEAIKECASLLKKDKGGRVRLALAGMKEAMGQTSGAMEDYRLAMEASNMRDVRAVAAHKYGELLSAASTPGREDRKLERVRFLRREWRLDEALDLIKEFKEEGCSSDLASDLTAQQAALFFYSGNIEAAKKFYRNSCGVASGAWMYARSLKRLGEWDQAAEMFLEAAKLYGQGERAQEARLEAWKLFLRLDKPQEANQAWAAILPAYRNRKFRDDSLWHSGFYHYRKKDFKKAAETFEQLARDFPKGGHATAGIYWKARSIERAGNKKDARRVYQSLTGLKSEAYYRMLSLQRLGKIKTPDSWDDLPVFQNLLQPKTAGTGSGAEAASPAGMDASGAGLWALSDPGLKLGDLHTERRRIGELNDYPGAPPGAVRRLKALSAAGVMDLALLEAEQLKAWKKTARQDDLNLRLFAFLSAGYAETGRYADWVRLQYNHFRLLVSGRSGNQALSARRRFYPLAYPMQVLESSREYSLHPALVLAMMRTESYYEPDILSYANARGLMQVLPSTGAKIAERMGRPAPVPDELFDPGVNIRFGCWYLSELTREFGGQFPLAIASYNAGPFNVRRWAESANGMSLEEFIEMIPFDQTRVYVKKILGHMHEYRVLFAGQGGGPDLSVPVKRAARNDINF